MPEADGSGSSGILGRKSRDTELQETHKVILPRPKDPTLTPSPGTGAAPAAPQPRALLSPCSPTQPGGEVLGTSTSQEEQFQRQFQRGPAVPSGCVRAVLGSGGLLCSAGACFECSECLGGLGLPQSPGGLLSCLTWPRWGREAELAHPFPKITPHVLLATKGQGRAGSVTWRGSSECHCVPHPGPATLWVWVSTLRSRPAPAAEPLLQDAPPHCAHPWE